MATSVRGATVVAESCTEGPVRAATGEKGLHGHGAIHRGQSQGTLCLLWEALGGALEVLQRHAHRYNYTVSIATVRALFIGLLLRVESAPEGRYACAVCGSS